MRGELSSILTLCLLAYGAPAAAQTDASGEQTASNPAAPAGQGQPNPALQVPDQPTADGQAGTRAGDFNVLNEIVVTAARQRNENVQTTPVAVTALNEALLARAQITSVQDLARIAPNLIIQRQLSTANQVAIYLRGFGNISNDPAIDPPIALYVDGIYQPIGSGTQLDTFGVESVEVERGPQGTLLGKNAPTGAISLNGRRPTGEWGGAAEASYERFDHRELKGRIDIPIITDVLAINGSLSYKKGGNFIRSLTQGGKRKFGGEDVLAARIGILFTPTEQIEWLIRMNGENTENPQTGLRDLGFSPPTSGLQQPSFSCVAFGRCTPTRRFTSNAGFTRHNKSDDRQVSSQLRIKLDPVTITAVTGYKTLNEINRSDVDAEPEAILDALNNPLKYQQFSQEVRLSSVKNNGLDFGGKLDWVVGGFYSNFHYTNSQLLRIFGTNPNAAPGTDPGDLLSFQRGRTKSYALFGHFVYNVTEKLSVTLGGRQSWDNKTHAFRNLFPVLLGQGTLIVDAPAKFKNFSIEAGAQYKFASDKNVYFRYAEGYRNGGYQGLPAGDVQRVYRPETVKTYEVGLKADFLDRHLRTNLSIFQSDYSDLQRTAILDPGNGTFGQFINNAASARVRGIELEATVVPVDALTVGFTFTYLEPKYKGYIVSLASGEPLTDRSNFPFPYSAKYTAKIVPTYVADLGNGGTLTISADATYTSTYYTGEIPYPLARVSPQVLMNASVRYDDPSSKYYVSIYGQNLTDRNFIQNYTTPATAPGGASLFSIGADHKPLTYGATVGFKF